MVVAGLSAAHLSCSASQPQEVTVRESVVASIAAKPSYASVQDLRNAIKATPFAASTLRPGFETQVRRFGAILNVNARGAELRWERKAKTTNASSTGFALHMGVSRIGRAGAMRTVAQEKATTSALCTHPSTAAAGSCAQRQVESNLLEWWDNRDTGIEHAFQISQRPDGGSSELRVDVSFDASEISVADDRKSVQIIAARGPALEYQALKVVDSRGQELASHFESSPAGVSIVIDDAGASYPITVDPLLTNKTPSATWEGHDFGAQGEFGWSVASAGDVNGDGYDDILVGTQQQVNSGTTPTPAANYVQARVLLFLGGPSGPQAVSWTQGVIGLNGSWPTVARGAGDVNGDGFDDVVVYESQGVIGNDECDMGGTRLFLGSAFGLSASPAATMLGSLEPLGDVDGDGKADLARIAGQSVGGCSSYLNPPADLTIYLGTADGISSTPKWTLGTSEQYVDSLAGADFNGDGSVDIVFKVQNYLNPKSGNGEPALFFFDGVKRGFAAGIAQPTRILFGATPDQFSSSLVAPAGDVNRDGKADLLISMNLQFAADGTVALFLGSPSGAAFPNGGGTVTPNWTVHGLGAGQYGSSQWSYNNVPANSFPMASAGDVNNDGFADVIVGAQYEPNSLGGTGKAMVYLGSTTGLKTTPALTFEHANNTVADPTLHSVPDIFLGHSVNSAGDVDGDGFDDVLISADSYTSHPGDYDKFHAHSRADGDPNDSPTTNGTSGLVCLNDCAAPRVPATRNAVNVVRCTNTTASVQTLDKLGGSANGSCAQCTYGNHGACTGNTPTCYEALGHCGGCSKDYKDGSVLGECTVDLPLCQANGICIKHCASSSDCADPLNPVCNQASGICGTACTIDTDCEVLNAQRWCDNPTGVSGGGSCVPRISDGEPLASSPPINGVCNVANAKRVCLAAACDDRVELCGSPTIGCYTDAECVGKDPAIPLCNHGGVLAGTCTSCSVRDLSHCPVATPTCNASGSCQACLADFNPSSGALQCPSTAPTCKADGSCFKCTADAQCTAAGKPFCDLSTGVCGSKCTTDTECKAVNSKTWCDNSTGASAAGICVPEYPNGEVLPSSAPINATCTTATGARVCLSGICDPADNRCGLPNGKSCTSDETCRTECTGGVCGECASSKDCKGAGHSTCNTKTNECGACQISATDCTDPSKAYCSPAGTNKGSCVACTNDSQCAIAGKTCDLATNQCVGGSVDAGTIDANKPDASVVPGPATSDGGCAIGTSGAPSGQLGALGLVALAMLSLRKKRLIA